VNKKKFCSFAKLLRRNLRICVQKLEEKVEEASQKAYEPRKTAENGVFFASLTRDKLHAKEALQ